MIQEGFCGEAVASGWRYGVARQTRAVGKDEEREGRSTGGRGGRG